MSTGVATKGGRLLTVREVIDRLGVSRATLYRLLDSGRLPGVRIGPRTLRFRPEVVEAFIDVCEHGAPRLTRED
jgi:excisionase family DNA binding protein